MPSARAVATLCLALAPWVIGCAGEAIADAPLPPAPVSAPHDALARGRALLPSVTAGRELGRVDAVVDALAALGQDEPARRSDAHLVAGRLLAARAARTRDARDLDRARDFLTLPSRSTDAAVSCAALRALADVHRARGDAAAEGALSEPLSRCAGAATAVTARVEPPRRRHRRVVIDAGHGGSDPGAIGPTGLTEASVTLDVARRVADRLATRWGVQVVLTRDRDVYVPLPARAAHANGTQADLFVSIHCNAANNREARGVSTFVLDAASPRVAQRVTLREGEILTGDPWRGGDVSRILADLRLSGANQRAVSFATAIQSAMLHDARLLYRDVDDMGVHPANFHVLVGARMPSVLVELSFISNALEEQRLRSDAYRDVLAGAVARAIAATIP